VRLSLGRMQRTGMPPLSGTLRPRL
jgi:hypothetical protein